MYIPNVHYNTKDRTILIMLLLGQFCDFTVVFGDPRRDELLISFKGLKKSRVAYSCILIMEDGILHNR